MYSVEILYRPKTLCEALEILKSDPAVLPMAGGTDILVKMRKRRLKNVRLMSLSQLSELKGISELADGCITIGAGVTFTEIASDSIVGGKLRLLKTAALSIGALQTQNVATIGGNILNGAVSADSAPPLFALDAVAELISADGERKVEISKLYIGPGKVDVRQGEIMTRFLIPRALSPRRGSAYIKMSTRKAMDISMLGSAAVCDIDEEGRIVKASIALGTAGPVPFRCTDAEAIATGKRLDKELLASVGEKAREESNPRSSWRASEEYRRYLAEELSARALSQAYQSAGGDCHD